LFFGENVITSADVLKIAPELTVPISAAQWTVLIAQAYAELNPSVWGAYLDTAATWFAAHLATITQRKGIPGWPNMRRVGEVSAANTVPPLLASAYSMTSYGIEFERLLMARPAARFDVA
jgi:hypothetical protein